MLAQLSDELKPKEMSYYYKAHSEHKGFDEAVAKMKKDNSDEKMEIAEVEEREADEVMLQEAEAEGIKVREDAVGVDRGK